MDRGEVDEAELAGGGLVVLGCQSAGGLWAVDTALDPVLQGVDEAVDRDRRLSRAPHRDHRCAASGLDTVADRIAVATLVCNQPSVGGRSASRVSP